MSSRHDKVRCELCRRSFKFRSGGFTNHLRFCKQKTLRLQALSGNSTFLGQIHQQTAYEAHDSALQIPSTIVNMAGGIERTAPMSDAGLVAPVVDKVTHQFGDSDDKIGPSALMKHENQPNEMPKPQPQLPMPPGNFGDIELGSTASAVEEAFTTTSIERRMPIIPPYIQLYRKPLVHHYVDGSGRIRKRRTITMNQVREMYKYAFQRTASAYVANFLGTSGIQPDQWPEPDSEFVKTVNCGQFPLVDGEIFRILPTEHLRGDWSYSGITRWTVCLAGVIQKDFVSKYLQGCFTLEGQPRTEELHEFASGTVFSALILHMKEIRSRYCDKQASLLKWLDSIEPMPLEEMESLPDAHDQVKAED